MALARLTNYVDGNILTGAQLNNEFDNVLNNGADLIIQSIPSVSQVQGLQGSVFINVGSFAANGYTLRSTSHIVSLSATSSYSINTQTAGPILNGRDQAAVFASTTVHFYAITTGIGSTAAGGIVSTRPPPLGPVMPTSYSAWAYLTSAIYTIASSQVTKNAYVTGHQNDFETPTAALSVGTATSATEVALGGQVPKNAHRILFSIRGLGANSTGGSVAVDHSFQALVGGGVLVNYATQFTGSTMSLPAVGRGSFSLPNLNSTAAIWYYHTLSNGTLPTASLDVIGFTVANGDA